LRNRGCGFTRISWSFRWPINAERPKVANKADAFARIGLDQNLTFSGIANSLSGRRNARAERGFRNNAAVPDRSDEIVPCHHAIAVLQKIKQEIKDLRLHGNRLGVAREFALVTVENAASEDELHRNSLTPER